MTARERVRKHRAKLRAEQCSRLEVWIGTWIVEGNPPAREEERSRDVVRSTGCSGAISPCQRRWAKRCGSRLEESVSISGELISLVSGYETRLD
jgi:hypothetical protein